MMKSTTSTAVLVVLAIVLAQLSCHHYSFTGANTTAKSVFIDYFQNKATNSPANLGDLFTEKLKEKFVRETSLQLKQSEAELNFTGNVTAYVISSEAATGAQTSAVNKLTIRVNVEYYSTLNTEDKWKQEFSRFSTYSSTQDISSVQGDLIDEISAQLADDIFTKALVKW